MTNYTIIPSNLQFQSSPNVDQQVNVPLDQNVRTLVEYDRSVTVSLAQVYDNERQASTIFRPTFKLSYFYQNVLTGTTKYIPFTNNLYYVDAEKSAVSGIWKGYPQYYEFDFFRDNIKDGHISYRPISAYTYNWGTYLTYPYKNEYNKNVFCTLNNTTFEWKVSNGIPFTVKNIEFNGNSLISFECVSPHGLSDGESVELSFSYGNKNIFQVYSLGNGLLNSDKYIFNVYNVGYTGSTFSDTKIGTFKRVVNPLNLLETRSLYYIRRHKVLTNINDLVMTKAGFEKNPFADEKKFEYSAITPNYKNRVSQKSSSNTYSITFKRDFNVNGLLDNQKRPVSELFLTIINKGFSGYFNKPLNNVGLKQGWEFNVTSTNNSWWDSNNVNSNTNIQVSSYTQTSGVTATFYYNQDLLEGDEVDGDICEWNPYYQIERVVSPYYQKIKYNQDVFQTTSFSDTNGPGYYYKSHYKMTIKVFSNYIETADKNKVSEIPTWSFFSNSDQQFRWRDIYTYGFFDELGRGVDYPYLNNAQYPFANVLFKLIPDNSGFNINNTLLGVDIPYRPIIDGCE